MRSIIFAGLALIAVFTFPAHVHAQDCTGPDGDIGTIIYNTNYNVFQGCADSGWIAFHDPCSGSPTPGTLCADGSVYAGTIDGDGSGPGGDVKIFIPPYDLDNSPHTAPNLMSDGVTNRGTFVYKVNNTESSVDECDPLNDDPACHDGQTLTEQLVNGTGPDGPNNPEEHHAAIACDNLSFGGKSDWYLPSIQELLMIMQNLADGAPDVDTNGISDDFNFDISGNFPGDRY